MKYRHNEKVDNLKCYFELSTFFWRKEEEEHEVDIVEMIDTEIFKAEEASFK